MLKNFLLLAVSAVSATSFAATELSTTLGPADAVSFRSHSVRHPSAMARNMHMLISNGLAAGCNSIYMYSTDDPFLYATTLKAVAAREKMLLIYDTDQATRGPWGDASSCMLTSITIIK